MRDFLANHSFGLNDIVEPAYSLLTALNWFLKKNTFVKLLIWWHWCKMFFVKCLISVAITLAPSLANMRALRNQIYHHCRHYLNVVYLILNSSMYFITFSLWSYLLLIFTTCSVLHNLTRTLKKNYELCTGSIKWISGRCDL